MRYQRGWIGDRARFRLGEKGRQTGFTYMEAYRATSRRLSGKRRCDYWLSSADLDTARLFIEYCDHWCEFNRTVIDRFPVELFDEETQSPLALAERIVFKETGCKITAVSSNPRAIRGKHGDVTLDESAHHDDERSMWAAAGAVKQWGGELAVMSTHNGMGTLFNRLCKDAALSPLQPPDRNTPTDRSWTNAGPRPCSRKSSSRSTCASRRAARWPG